MNWEIDLHGRNIEGYKDGDGAVGLAVAGGPGQQAPASKGIGSGGLPMKKKDWPKAAPKKLTEKVGWKKSFGVYKTAQSSKRGPGK